MSPVQPEAGSPWYAVRSSFFAIAFAIMLPTASGADGLESSHSSRESGITTPSLLGTNISPSPSAVPSGSGSPSSLQAGSGSVLSRGTLKTAFMVAYWVTTEHRKAEGFCSRSTMKWACSGGLRAWPKPASVVRC